MEPFRRHLRAKVTAVALVVSLVGGSIGIEAVASHLAGEQARSGHTTPAPATRVDDGPATTASS